MLKLLDKITRIFAVKLKSWGQKVKSMGRLGTTHATRTSFSQLLTTSIFSVVLASVVVTATVIGITSWGGLNFLELEAYDRMLRLQPFREPDPRVVVIGITESDIQAQQRWPLSDRVIAELLEKLQQYNPRVIGLDLYRDIPHPPGNEELQQQLKADNVVAIYKLGESEGVSAPSVVPAERAGFNDLLLDADDVLRRSLMYADTGSEQLYSFSLRIALQYLRESVEVTTDALKIGQTVFIPLDADSGGYRMLSSEAAGWQTLLHYSSKGQVARQISLTEALNGEIEPSWLKDKVVLVGTTAPSAKDMVLTPFNERNNFQLSGVEAHAQMTSQIISAVLDDRIQFRFWSEGQEWLWIWCWSWAGGAIVWKLHRPLTIAITLIIALATLGGVSFGLFLSSVWVPLAAPAIALIITAGWVLADKFIYGIYHDPLTKLPNRNLFIKRLSKIGSQKRSPQPTATVIVLDINRFKIINDSLGTNIGDRLLIALAYRIKACLPPSALLARIGGNEFAIWSSLDSDPQQARVISQRLQTKLALPFLINGQEIYTTVSIGIANSGSQTYFEPENLLRNAHLAMYRAKVLGKIRPETYTPSIHEQTLKHWQLETDLRSALNNGEFQLYYQPIVDLKTGKIAGFEALLRWNSPKWGIVSPSEFIPIAEATGLIIPIGQWVLQQACCQMKLWYEQFANASALIMSINLSVRQFSQPELVEQIKQTINELNLDYRNFKLEITESMVMDDVEFTITLLNHLKALNLQLCIDDFGTGYSSFSSLHRFPIDTLKVDKSFVSPIENNPQYAETVNTIITLGHNLGMEIIAEGIETENQLQMLRALGCEYGQGYFFAKPLTEQAASLLLRENPQW